MTHLQRYLHGRPDKKLYENRAEFLHYTELFEHIFNWKSKSYEHTVNVGMPVDGYDSTLLARALEPPKDGAVTRPQYVSLCGSKGTVGAATTSVSDMSLMFSKQFVTCFIQYRYFC